MRVYILSTYEEHGSYGLKATLDKTKVEPLLQSYIKDYTGLSFEHEAKVLEKLLESDTPSTEGYNLSDGWGGFMLHIVELD